MISENDYILSFYEPLSEIDGKEHITLVKNTATGQLYVKKTLSVYDRAVFEFIRRCKPQNVPRIIEILQDQEDLIVIEEYFSGRSIQEVLDERGALPLWDTLMITDALLRILLPFHSANPPIVHRDIKPGNLLLSSDGVLKLVDFNAAKLYSPDKARDTQLFGTVGYAAPEQYGFATSSPATDIFAVGILITKLSTGGSDPAKLPEILRPIVEKCTRLDPADRYQDAAALLTDLAPLLSNPSMPVRTAPQKSRRPSLPPGFRTMTAGKKFLGSIGYLQILLVSVIGGIKQDTGMPPIMWMLYFFSAPVLSVFVEFNYLGIREKLPLLKSSFPALRTIGVILYPIIISAFLLLLLVIIAGITGYLP